MKIQGNRFATTRAYLKGNRDIVKAALKGYIEGIHFTFHNKQAGARKSMRNICELTIPMFSNNRTR